MAEISDSVKSRSLEAVRVLSSLGRVRAAYVFGSQAEGGADRWSDLDIAAFVEGVEDWDIRRRAQAMAHVQKRVGADVEIHLFPAFASENPPAGSFADHVRRCGARLKVEEWVREDAAAIDSSLR